MPTVFCFFEQQAVNKIQIMQKGTFLYVSAGVRNTLGTDVVDD